MKGPSGPTAPAQFSACCSSKLKCIQCTAGSIVAFIVQLNLLDLTQQARNKQISSESNGSFMVSWKFHVSTNHGTSWNHPTIQRCKSKFDLSLSDLNDPPSNLNVFIICHIFSLSLSFLHMHVAIRRNTSQTPWHISAIWGLTWASAVKAGSANPRESLRKGRVGRGCKAQKTQRVQKQI